MFAVVSCVDWYRYHPVRTRCCSLWLTLFLFAVCFLALENSGVYDALKASRSKDYQKKGRQQPQMQDHELDPTWLLQSVEQAFELMKQEQRRNYGQYYDLLFNNASSVFRRDDDDVPHRTFKHKLLMSLLRNDATFVLAVAGMSSAAGKGNYHDENYAKVLEATIQPIFQALNKTFESRNFGMSSMKSAPELALCIDQLYGTDLDLLIWDFAMTDGTKQPWRRELFTSRAMLHPARPAFMAMHLTPTHYQQIVQGDQQFGWRTVAMDPNVMSDIQERIPDTFGWNDTHIQQLPPLVRNFKCNGRLESGEPYCQDEKFTVGSCPKRKFRTSWHPGWKQHALSGHILAVYIAETLLEVLSELPTKPFRHATLLNDLISQQAAEYQSLWQSSPPSLPRAVFNLSERDSHFLYREPSICHSAKLPSQIRRSGVLTGETFDNFDTHYEEGVDRDAIHEIEGGMQLSFDPTVRQKQCGDVATAIDYPDFFAVLNRTRIFLPTARERLAYPHFESPKGFIAMCLMAAETRYNPRPRGNEISLLDILEHQAVTFAVNGQPVVRVLPIGDIKDDMCFGLLGSEGHFWKANAQSQYEIEFQLNPVNGHTLLPISSIIVI